jgi:hypothetical protein
MKKAVGHLIPFMEEERLANLANEEFQDVKSLNVRECTKLLNVTLCSKSLKVAQCTKSLKITQCSLQKVVD